jgi:thioredoxin-related protein
MGKGTIFICAFGILSVSLAAQTNPSAISWYSWNEGISKAAKESRKIMIYIFTPSCTWCRKMESETFSKSEAAQLVRAEFIPVKLNAQEDAELAYKGKTYRMTNSGPRSYHALAAEMLEGRMSFPSIVFFDEKQNPLQAIAGFKSLEEFLPIATYYGKGYYKTMPWSSFQKKHTTGN